MVGGSEKFRLLRGSKGLVFPVRWPEPFGLAITESLYFGCPVFGTPYGSLPELVTTEVGVLSNKKEELASAIRHAAFDRKTCHEYARDRFNARIMAEAYLTRYERVLNGEHLNLAPPRALKPRDRPYPWEN
jgi:glycosyltransferase involved in cell wall biosynthesis